jgi:ribose-phosphate pyrophosphokinase
MLPLQKCEKVRDPGTGKLSGFSLVAGPDLLGAHCIIFDDICDGGGTFAGVSTLLKDAGASWVGLAVTHGIFSKGFHIPGIDYIWTTNSYESWGEWALGGNVIENFSVTEVPNPTPVTAT